MSADDYRCESTTTTGARCKNHAITGYRDCWLHATVDERAEAICWDEQEAIEVAASMAGYLWWELREFLQ